jgi:hypothetical protein
VLDAMSDTDFPLRSFNESDVRNNLRLVLKPIVESLRCVAIQSFGSRFRKHSRDGELKKRKRPRGRAAPGARSLIEEYKKKHDVGQKEIIALTKLGRSTFCVIKGGRKRVSVDSLQSFANGIGCSLKALTSKSPKSVVRPKHVSDDSD